MEQKYGLIWYVFVVGLLQILVIGVQATPINFGDTVTGTIATAGHFDSYTFDATSGDHAFLRMQSDPLNQIRVFAPNGTPLSTTQNNYDCQIDQYLPDTGTYTVLLGDADGVRTGPYQFFIQRTNNPANAGAFAYGESRFGTIDPSVQMKSYTMTAGSGDYLFFHMNSSWQDNGKGKWLRLYGPDGSLVTSSQIWWISGSYYGWMPEGEIAAKVAQAGTYTLLVGSGGSERNITGTYDVFGQRTNNPGNAVLVQFGDPVSGSTTSSAFMKTYTFAANAGDRAFLRMHSDPLNQIRVFSPNGTPLSTTQSNYDCQVDQYLPDTGTYTVLLGNADVVRSGLYQFFVQRTNNPVNAAAFAYGESRFGTIDPSVQMKSYTMTAGSGDYLFFHMNSSWQDNGKGKWLRLYGPDGSLVTSSQIWWISGSYSGWMPAGEIAAKVAQAGTYTLLVGSGGSERNITGMYDVFGQRTNNPGNAVPVQFGDTVSGSTTSSAFMKTYMFAANAGDRAFLRMQSDPLNQIRVFAPNGTPLSTTQSNYDCQVDQYLQDTGTYTVLLGDADVVHSGPYQFFVQRTNNPANAAAFTFGIPHSGTIDPSVQMKSYSIQVHTNDSVTFHADSSWHATGQGEWLRLYAPDGTLVTSSEISWISGGYSGWMPGGDISARAPTNGIYHLLVGSGGSERNLTGSFTLTGQIKENPGPVVHPLPSMNDPPTDPDGDGIYEDLNANGRLDFADVVLYFNQITWIAANEPIAAFDLNGNGRIDFADIVALFNEI